MRSPRKERGKSGSAYDCGRDQLAWLCRDCGSVHATSRRHGATYLRLIPVGFGYRYAARGLWLDGWRSNADLYFGKREPIACTVALG